MPGRPIRRRVTYASFGPTRVRTAYDPALGGIGMFLKTNGGWVLENSSTQQMKCPNCRNTTDHVVYVHPYGPQVGLIFLSKPLLSLKKYFLACPVCSHLAKELTKEQAHSMRVC